MVRLEEGADWAQIQDNVQNCVVQVFAQVGKFNWTEPYKVDDQSESRASGFIINAEGYIVTNAHVIDEAKRVWVHIPFFGRKIIHVDVIGFCAERDLALLKIRPEELGDIEKGLKTIPFLDLGDSDSVQRTDPILVLGYPLGQYHLKTTTGIISGREAGQSQSLLQMTAVVNPGSSGGPLLNTQGKVIGLTVSNMSQAQNVGYAIPINELKYLLRYINQEKLVRLPMLGVLFVFSNDYKAEYLGNPIPSGLYISNVLKKSLFEEAGVQPGDMLYEFNGFDVDAYGESSTPWGSDKSSLTDLTSRLRLDDDVHMVIYRKGERKELKFKFKLMPPAPIRRIYPDFEPVDFETIGGLVLMQLADNHFADLLEYSPNLMKYTDPKEKSEPVIVISHVLPGSLAFQLRCLVEGDVIKEINGRKVGTLKEYREAVEESLTTEFLTIKTERDIFAVFLLEDLLADEPKLSKDFDYPISKLVEKLIKNF